MYISGATSKLNWSIFENLHKHFGTIYGMYLQVKTNILYCSSLILSLTLDQMDELTKEVLRSDCGSKSWNPLKNFLDMKKKCHF